MGKIRFGLVAGGVFCAGMFVGDATDWAPRALGEVRSNSAPQSFQTGGQLSVPILRDISATLQQMDERLARMELSVKQIQQGRLGRAQ